MGEVYRATDTNLKRPVAVKVLPNLAAADGERLARFQREAEVLGALNHPNIAQIYGLERFDGMTALVMELVEGETLADRIARGRLPLDEALPIARQILEALETAHEQGIVHRDLKPANIKVRADGTVKVLDFGLAKALELPGAAPLDTSKSPTQMTTRGGLIMGTAAYMSPEQAASRPVDKRSDLWAFGVVLFEMLAGRPPFTGESVAHVVAAVLKEEPDWTLLPPETPLLVRRLLRRCLAKDRKRRLDSAANARLDIDESLAAPAPAAPPDGMPVRPSRRGAGVAWTIAALAVVVAGVLAVPALRYLRQPPSPETRLDIAIRPSFQPSSVAISPDGRLIVFAAGGEGGSRLWLRSLASASEEPLEGTEGASYPFWSPDSRSLGFFAAGALKVLDLDTSTARTVAAAPAGRGGTWTADGAIVFAPNVRGRLMQVPAGGGAPVATKIGAEFASPRWPQALPEGRRFLFYATGADEAAGIYLGSADGGPSSRLTLAAGAGTYVPPGWLLWVRSGALVGQRVDLDRGTLTGEAVRLADGVVNDPLFRGAVATSASGLIAFWSGGLSQRQLTWVDRSGGQRGTVGEADTSLLNVALSHDGRRVAASRTVQGRQDLWLLDGVRVTRFTGGGTSNSFPVWSPDGARVVYRSYRGGGYLLYEKVADGVGGETPALAPGQTAGGGTPTSWSADGRFVLTMGGVGAEVMQMADTRTLVVRTAPRERWGAFSPDAKWIAFQSDDTGQTEIFVRPFVAPAGPGAAAPVATRWQVSTAGGIHPLWSHDGKELYYVDPAGDMMAAPMIVRGAAIEPGSPVKLFSTRILGGGIDSELGRQYAVAPDGRFLVNTILNDLASPITLVLNWSPGSAR